MFKQGVTFEWVKNKVAIALEAKYNDLSLYFNDKRIPEPFSIVDLPYVVSGSIIQVEIAEGAEVGLDKLRQQVLEEIERDGAEAGAEDVEEKKE